MKRFLWFNLEKLRTDVEYFLVSYILVIIATITFLFPKSEYKFGDAIFGGASFIFFIYLTSMKRDFSLKNVWKRFWEV